MSLHQKITDDMKASMKSGDKDRLEVLRFALAHLNAAKKEKTLKDPAAELTDEETITILQKDAKRRKESIELFRQGKREDLVKKEEAELAIVSGYLPEQMSRAEIGKIVDEIKAGGVTDFNMIMRDTMKAVKGRADGKLVGEVIKEKTNN